MDVSRWRVFAITIVAAVAGGALVIAPVAAAESSDEVSINLVVTNDFHGHIDDHVVQWAATVQQLLADGPADGSLFLGAGDMVGESLPASAAQHDDPTLDILNRLGLDASAVGNHEFDNGYDDLVSHIAARADFPILAANVTKADRSPLLKASTMFTVSGVRLAVIGAVTDTTPELLPPASVEGLTFTDPVAAINTEVARLESLPEDQRPDVIVASIHDGAPWGTWELDQAKEQSAAFAHLVEDTSPEVDAIVTGHTHNTYVFNAPIPGDPDRTRPLIQTGSGGDNVGQIKLTVDGNTGAVTASSARNVPRLSTSDADLTASDPVLADIATIRDDAVAFAEAHTAAQQEAQHDYDAAVARSDDAYTAAVKARDDYQAGVSAADEAHTSALSARDAYDAAVAPGKKAFAKAADLLKQYDAAVAAGKASYSEAADLKTQHATAIAQGKQAYADAADLKEQYATAIAQRNQAYADAADLKEQYTTAITTGKDALENSARLKQQYDDAVVDGKAAYTEAAELKQQYADLLDTGVSESDPQATELMDSYQAAMSAGKDAYATATDLVQPYQDAIAASQDAYTKAGEVKDDYDTAIATAHDANATATALVTRYQDAISAGKDAYADAAAIVPKYQDAIAAGQAAYADAAALVPQYQDAMSAGKDAYAAASGIKDQYDAAMTSWDALLATAETLKATFETAVDTWHAALDLVTTTKATLLDLLL